MQITKEQIQDETNALFVICDAELNSMQEAHDKFKNLFKFRVFVYNYVYKVKQREDLKHALHIDAAKQIVQNWIDCK